MNVGLNVAQPKACDAEVGASELEVRIGRVERYAQAAKPRPLSRSAGKRPKIRGLMPWAYSAKSRPVVDAPGVSRQKPTCPSRACRLASPTIRHSFVMKSFTVPGA